MTPDQAKPPVKKALKLPPRAPSLRVKPTFMQKSKYKDLLDDPNVQRWFRKLLRRSPASAGKNLSRLGWLCEHFDTSPKELARLSKRKAEDWTEDMISLLEDNGKRSSYISNLFKTAKSWFKHNRKHVEVEYKVAPETGLYAQEKPPTNEELRRILDAADIRQKVAISLMAFSGFRDQTLGDLTGVDGLKISDFPEMKIANGTVEFNAIPTFVTCRATISKSRYEYRSLLNEDLDRLRKAYERLDEAHLTTLGKRPETPERVRSSMRETMLEMLGFTEEERQKIDLGKLTNDQFRDLLHQKAASFFGLNGKNRQKIIPMSQVAEAITEGWEYVTQLPNDQAVIRSPL